MDTADNTLNYHPVRCHGIASCWLAHLAEPRGKRLQGILEETVAETRNQPETHRTEPSEDEAQMPTLFAQIRYSLFHLVDLYVEMCSRFVTLVFTVTFHTLTVKNLHRVRPGFPMLCLRHGPRFVYYTE